MAKRTFNHSDESLIQYAGNQLSFLEEDLAAFAAFDADLGETRRNDLAVLIQWLLEEGGDELNVSKLGGFTEQLLVEMENSRRLYHQIRYWAAKAFPDRKAIQRQFGIGRFNKIAKSQESMIVFLSSVANSIEEYRAELEAANAPASLLDSVAPQAIALQNANNAQEKKKGTRMVDTEDRISRLNQLYQHTKDYNTAAEYVFYDFPAKRERYRPPANAATVD